MKNKATTSKGGKRKGAGRKPLPEEDRKKPIIVYVTDRQIEKKGGIDIVMDKLQNVIK